jgi:serine protease
MKILATNSFSHLACLLILSMTITGNLYAGEQHLQGLYSQASVHPTPSSTDRLIIKYKPGWKNRTLPSSASNLVAGMAGTSSTEVKLTYGGAHVIRLNQEIPLEEMQVLAHDIEQLEDVDYAEPDLIMYPQYTPNDPQYAGQWNYFQEIGGINLPLAWDITQGANTIVAVVDTGYLPHEDLIPNILPGYDLISDVYAANDGDGRDSDPTDPGDQDPTCGNYISSWHGTHVAGTIAALTNNALGVAGIAFKSKIVPIRVVGRCGGYLSDIMDGVLWAAGATLPDIPVNPNPAQVINISLGSDSDGCPQTAIDAIERAHQLGATVIAAAGNKNIDSAKFSPGNCPGVITVAATDQDATRASFSNYGDAVDLSAPGVGILSTFNNGVSTPQDDSYRFMEGTSMATPHVSGVAALLYSLKPDITPDQVAQILKQTTQAFPSDCPGCGTGILDAKAAVETLQRQEQQDPNLTLLDDDAPITDISAGQGEALMFAIDVPAEATSLNVSIKGGSGSSGDADLYLLYDNQPTKSDYDCRPYLFGNWEHCMIRPANPGRYYIMLQGYSAFSKVSLVADYQLADPEPVTSSNYENLKDYPIPDRSLQGVSSPISVDHTGNAGTINIAVTIRHTSIRELLVKLIDPSETGHTLKGFGGSGVDLIKNYTLNLENQPAQGTWKLKAMDLGNSGTGMIDSWGISIL